MFAFSFSRVITPFSFFVVFRCRVENGLAVREIDGPKDSQLSLLRQDFAQRRLEMEEFNAPGSSQMLLLWQSVGV